MKIRLSITPAMLILFCCMLATTPLPRLAAGLLAAAVHELGHLAAAAVLGINLRSIKLDVLGARLTTEGRLHSYPAEVALCLAGPFVNFLSFALLLPFMDRAELLSQLALASLSLGVFNLIPVGGFDGGRILSGLLHKLLPPTLAEGVAGAASFVSVLCLWMLSVWLLLRTGTSLSLFVFSCCLFGMLFVG